MPWSTPWSTKIGLSCYLLYYLEQVWSLAGITIGEETCVVMLLSLGICIRLFGARHSTRSLACSHISFLQILQAKEHQAGSQFLDKKPPRNRLLLQRYWRRPWGAICVLACMHTGFVSLFLLLPGIFILQKSIVLFSSVSGKLVILLSPILCPVLNDLKTNCLRSADRYSDDYLRDNDCSVTSWISICTKCGLISSVELCLRFLDAISTRSSGFFPTGAKFPQVRSLHRWMNMCSPHVG